MTAKLYVVEFFPVKGLVQSWRSQGRPEKKKAPNRSSGPFVILSRRRPTFPHSYPCSIIGPARLNFRVRDGNGCDPRGMTTGNLGKLAALAESTVDSLQSTVPEKSEAALRKSSEKIGAAPVRAPRTTVLAGEYKFGPLPNKYCVLQDVAERSRNQPAMNSSQADRR
jgi:hypothetical protein